MALLTSTIQIPVNVRSNEIVGAGMTSYVQRLNAVVKSYDADGSDERDREIAVYKRLSHSTSNNNILQYYGTLDNLGVVLQYASGGTIRSYLKYGQPVESTTKLRWAQQIAKAVSFLHSQDILHCDISSNNVFLDGDLNALIGDFSGSAIDDLPPTAWYETSHAHPDISEASYETEIFALGSTLYEIVTEAKPFEHLADEDIEEAIRSNQFPPIGRLPVLKEPIMKCWRRQYSRVEELLEDINEEDKIFNSSWVWHPQAPLILCTAVAVVPLLLLLRSAKLSR